MNLEVNEVAPVRHPLVEQRPVMSFHELVATLESIVDPARDVAQTLRRHAASSRKASIYGHCIAVLEMLNHHVERFREK